ncbi:MAG: ribosome maturation factor RimM [Pseudanabaenaceae cyanobacterium bins.68]|nr:ribosome maturation factor RimM [Pseudanabaenaceae cyanobacterium bins.68]
MIEWLVIGKILAPQGLKGEVRVYSYSDFAERFTQPGQRWLAHTELEPNQLLHLVSGRILPSKQNIYVVKFAEIQTCDRAAELRDLWMMVPRTQRPSLAPEEFHVPDLIGCLVYHHTSQAYIGEVIGVIAAGNDLLEIDTGTARILVPFVGAIAINVEISQKRIEILPPEGLLNSITP